MDRRELNRMFDALGPDPKREGELLEELLQGETRRKLPVKNWKRAAIALAAAVMLVGTAAAAHYAGIRVVDSREENGFIEFADGMTYYAADQLSDEVKEFEAAYTGGSAPMKTFTTWDAMENFLSVDLMNSPLLDASRTQSYHIEINNGEQRVKGRFILTVYQGLTQFIARGCYEVGGCNVQVQAYLFTDRSEEYGTSDKFYGVRFHEAEVTWESCTTPGGRQAQVVEAERGEGRSSTCLGAVSLDGIPILVRVRSSEGAEKAREILMQVLDSFQ